MSKICLYCGNELDGEEKFCNICGTKITAETAASNDPLSAQPEPEPTLCGQCGEPVTTGNKFCRSCGTPLHEQPEAVRTQDVQAEIPPHQADEQMQHASAPQPSSGTNWKAIGSVISTVLTIIFLFWLFTNHPIRDTQGIVFEQYGTVELGDAVDRALTNVSWDAEKVANKEYFVTASGYSTEWGSRISLTFDVNYAGDHVYAKPIYASANGESADDAVSLAVIMALLYS